MQTSSSELMSSTSSQVQSMNSEYLSEQSPKEQSQLSQSEKLSYVENKIEKLKKLLLFNNGGSEKIGLMQLPERNSQQIEEIEEFISRLVGFYINKEKYKLQTKKNIDLTFMNFEKQFQDKNKFYIEIIKEQEQGKKSKNYAFNKKLQKESQSKVSTIPLKEWFIENYDNPYPNEEQIDFLVKKSKFSKRKVLSWFVNTRNCFKTTSKLQNEFKFKDLVRLRYLETQLQKKIKTDQEDQNLQNIK